MLEWLWQDVHPENLQVSVRIKQASMNWESTELTTERATDAWLCVFHSDWPVTNISCIKESAEEHYCRLTSLNELVTLLFCHVLPEVSIDKAIDVSAAGATNGTRLPHTHPTKWNAVHLVNKPTSAITITTVRRIYHTYYWYIYY